MKKYIFMVLVFCCTTATAQLSTKEPPFSFTAEYKALTDGLPMISIDRKSMDSLNMEIIEKEDYEDELSKVPPRFGYPHKVDYNLNNAGTWQKLPNGDRIWQLKIYCHGKVFRLQKGSDEEYMLYDFNADVGAVVYHLANDIADIYLTVRDIDYVPVGGEERKRMILTMTEILNGGTEKREYPDNVVWVEGIGSIGLFDSPETAFVSGGSGWLLGCYEDGSKVFSQENFYPEREIPYENLTIDEARNTFGMVTCRLALDGSKVEMCDGECLVLADSNSGNHVRLFDMGCEFAEGTELGGYIAGLLCSWNDMMTLFPTRSTDISEILSSDDGIRGFGSAEKMHNSLIFDIEGKTVGNLPTNRKKYIYISNRKKYLWNKE